MTNDRMALIELIEKDADADLVREMLAFAANRVMALEVDALTGAAAGARTPAIGSISATGTGRVRGTPGSAPSISPSPSCAVVPPSRAFSIRDGRPKKP